MYKVFSVKPTFSLLCNIKTLKGYKSGFFPNTILVDKTGKIVSSTKDMVLNTINFPIPTNFEEYQQGWQQFCQEVNNLGGKPIIRLCRTIDAAPSSDNDFKYGWGITSVNEMFLPLFIGKTCVIYQLEEWLRSVSAYGYYYPYFCFEILKLDLPTADTSV